jgi:hypothetical protein
MPCSNQHPVVKIEHFNQFQAGPAAHRIKHPRLAGAIRQPVPASIKKTAPASGVRAEAVLLRLRRSECVVHYAKPPRYKTFLELIDARNRWPHPYFQ